MLVYIAAMLRAMFCTELDGSCGFRFMGIMVTDEQGVVCGMVSGMVSGMVCGI